MEDKLNNHYGAAAYFSTLLPALLFLLLIVIGVHYFAGYKSARKAIEASETLNVSLARRALESELDTTVTDLLMLARLAAREWQLRGGDPESRKELERLFIAAAASKGKYDQIRLIGGDGWERVRVNFNGGAPAAVEAARLQYKGDRYYFKDALKRIDGAIYVSPLDLNVEQGVLERPLKPMLRLVVPINDGRGGRVILVLNYLGERLLDSFSSAAANIADHIHLIDGNGWWLSAPDGGDEWGQELGHDHRFSTRYLDGWRALQRGEEGHALIGDAFYSHTTIDLASGEGPRYRWYVVARLPVSETNLSPVVFFGQNMPLYSGVLVLLALLAWLLARSRASHHQAMVRVEYERLFRQTLESINLAAVTLGRDGKPLFCNPCFLKNTGWRWEDLKEKNWIDCFIPTRDRAGFVTLLKELDDSQAVLPTRYENRIVMRDGAQRNYVWHTTPAFSPDSSLIGVTAIGEDVTEQLRNAEQVRKLTMAVEQSPSIVVITDRGGSIEYVNPQFKRTTGYSGDEVIGKNPRILKSGETSDEEYAQLWRTIIRGDIWRGQFHNRRKSGALYWEEALIAPLRDERGDITHFLAVKEDVSERKRLANEVRERRRELAQHQALAEVGRMASMIAHDLRNPLSSVKMALQMLGRRGERPDELEMQQIGMEQIGYMESILRDMLAYSRPEALHIDWLDVGKVLQSTLLGLQRRFDDASISVGLEEKNALPTIPADSGKLRQIFSNLLINSVHALESVPEQDRRIEVTLSSRLTDAGTMVIIVFRDNGGGLPDGEDGKRLFEPFHTTRSKGTGLGLAIVQRIVEQHHGEVTLLPQDPRGAVATVDCQPLRRKDSV